MINNRINTYKKYLPGIAIIIATAGSFSLYPTKANAWCIPVLHNCMCTWVFPCPVIDYGQKAQFIIEKTTYAAKMAITAKNLIMQKNIAGAIGMIPDMDQNIPDVSMASNNPMTFAGAAPATTAGSMGSNEPISTSVYEGANIALEATYESGGGDTPQIAFDRQEARNAFNRKNATEAYARALEYRATIQKYRANEQIIENDLEKSQDINTDLKVNASIKKQIDSLNKDIINIQYNIIQYRMGNAITTKNANVLNTSTGPLVTALNEAKTLVPPGKSSYPTMSPNSQSAPYDPTIEKDSNAYGDPSGMIRWQINKESSFNPNAQSKISTAHGLAQIVKGTAANPGYGIPPVNSSDPQASINFCTQYDSILFKKYQDWNKVLHAYGTT